MIGWELLKEIAEGNIKEGTKFKEQYGYTLYFDGYNLRFNDMNGQYFKETVDDVYFTNCNFELIEDQEEINIQDIEELDEPFETPTFHVENRCKINELIKAIKQLDNKLKEENK